jgi:GNAT superfamily N-acetyltransferase
MEIRLETNPPISNEDLNALFSSSWTGHKFIDFERELKAALAYICAYDGELLIGFVKLGWDGGVHTFLLDTTVHAEYQRRGIGRMLVERALETAREQGLEWVHVDYEPHLERFYQKLRLPPDPGGAGRAQAGRLNRLLLTPQNPMVESPIGDL